MTPALDCDGCGTMISNKDAWVCHASCCKGDQQLCSNCWQRHYAQFFLDAHGFPDGSLGDNHDYIVSLMALYRQHH